MRRLLLLVVLSGAIVACQDKVALDLTLPKSDASVAGVFNLVDANGAVPPYDAFVTSTDDWTVLADRIVIDSVGGWADTTVYAVTSFSTGVDSTHFTASAGTYSLANGAVNFVMTAGGNSAFTGSVVGASLFVNFNGARYIYQK
jgi:hypothetical protein